MSYDRVIRAELYHSERWLDLPSDTHRLVYNGLLHECDDFGNMEGGVRRLWRWMHSFATVKTEADATKLMSDLQDADLIRRYEVDGREYWHIPRTKNHRRYVSRKFPRSPWCPVDKLSTVERISNRNRVPLPEPAAVHPQTSGKPAEDLLRGVGVGVGVEVDSPPLPPLAGGVIAQSAPRSKPNLQGQWWKDPKAIEAAARQLGMWPARNGEGWDALAARIRIAVNGA